MKGNESYKKGKPKQKGTLSKDNRKEKIKVSFS